MHRGLVVPFLFFFLLTPAINRLVFRPRLCFVLFLVFPFSPFTTRHALFLLFTCAFLRFFHHGKTINYALCFASCGVCVFFFVVAQVCSEGLVYARVTRTGKASTLQQIVRLVEQAQVLQNKTSALTVIAAVAVRYFCRHPQRKHAGETLN